MTNIFDDKSIMHELFLNSYEARLLHSGICLLELKTYPTLNTDIEKDLFLIKSTLNTANLKKHILKFSVATFFFYKFVHNLLLYKTDVNKSYIKEQKYIEFIFLFKEFFCFIIAFDSAIDLDEKNDLGEEFSKELQTLKNEFYNKYNIFGLLKKIYSSQMTFLMSFKNDFNDKQTYINGIMQNFKTNFQGIDTKDFLSIIETLKSNFTNNGFEDRYGYLKNEILNHVEIPPNEETALIRDYEITTENESQIYKIVILDLKELGIYSNVNIINAFEILNNTILAENFLFVFDEFFTMLYVLYYKNTKIDNFLYYINFIENKENISYSDILEQYFQAQLLKKTNTIILENKQLLDRLPKTNLLQIFKLIQHKIAFSLKDIFYIPDKYILQQVSLNGVNTNEITCQQSSFLINSTRKLLKQMYQEIAKKQSQDHDKKQSQDSK